MGNQRPNQLIKLMRAPRSIALVPDSIIFAQCIELEITVTGTGEFYN